MLLILIVSILGLVQFLAVKLKINIVANVLFVCFFLLNMHLNIRFIRNNCYF